MYKFCLIQQAKDSRQIGQRYTTGSNWPMFENDWKSNTRHGKHLIRRLHMDLLAAIMKQTSSDLILFDSFELVKD